MNKELEIISSALDSVDERVYSYTLMGSAKSTLPSSILLDTGFIQDQTEAGYKMGCVYFSAAEGSNWSTEDRLQGGTLCEKSTTRSSTQGDYIVNGAKLLLKEGIIAGYSQVNTLEDIKSALANKRVILTGSNTIDWKQVKDSPYIAKGDKGAGHAFHIIGYDDETELLACKNSYGTDYQDEGLFYIKYTEYDKYLYNTKVALIESEKTIIAYKKKIMSGINIDSAKKAFESGLWNGERPTETASREEVAAMIQRAIEKLNTK